MIEQIHISFDVDCPAAHALDVWTARISSWWPRSHTMSAEPDADVVLERRVGGRIYERTTRVEIEHRGWERPGAEAGAWRERNYVAWGTLLPRYRDALIDQPGKV
jgi:hypothetical protein